MAQALSARLARHDTMAGSNFWTEERRTIVLSLPTESGEKARHLACLIACLPTYPPTHLPTNSDSTKMFCPGPARP